MLSRVARVSSGARSVVARFVSQKMDVIAPVSWSPADICLAASAEIPDESLATAVNDRVCRTDFRSPGFCLVDLGTEASTQSLRRFMVDLKQKLRTIHQARADRDLVFLSMARFDQQSTTKLHRDGGPDECFLMLGYEPSPIRAELAMADYSKCAHEMGLTPAEFLDQHNPMFGHGEELLRSYTTPIACFSNERFQIVLINNSSAPYSANETAWQGVLHTATIRNPSDGVRRVVNSTMVASVPRNAPEPLSEAEQDDFLTTNVVHRRGYKRTHLSDDR